MAVYNEILAGRFNRFVQKLLSIKGPTSLVAMSADLQFQHPVHSGAECRYLEGWDVFGRTIAMVAPGAGNQLQMQLRNPTGSGIVAVVTRAIWEESAATNTSISVNSGLAVILSANQVDQNTLDPRIGWDQRGRPSSTCILSHNTAAPAALGGNFQNIMVGSAAAFVLVDMILPVESEEIALLPGAIIQLSAGNLNTGALGGLHWRERPLEDSEKF